MKGLLGEGKRKGYGAGMQPEILGSFPTYPNLHVCTALDRISYTDPKQPKSLQSKCKKMHRTPVVQTNRWVNTRNQ